MDSRNLFETSTTYTLLRLEYFTAMLACIVLAIWHLAEIRWWVLIGLFAYIDLIGYIPGAIAYRLSKNKRISTAFYVCYNSMHSLITGAVVAGAWAWFVQPEWALLGIPIHLFGDRSIFGSFLKPFNVSFEPVAHPAFVRFQESYAKLRYSD